MSGFAPRTASASREIGTIASVVDGRDGPDAARAPPNRRRAAPATACCASSVSVAQRKPRAPKLGGDLLGLGGLLGHAGGVPWNSKNSVGARRGLRASSRRCRRSICASSSSSMRASGMPGLHHLDHRLHRAASVGNWQVAAEIASGMPCRRKLDLGDHAERALGADEQPRQVVAGGGLAHPPAGADHPAVRQHRRQPQHVLADGAVAHRIGAAGAGRAHAADGAAACPDRPGRTGPGRADAGSAAARVTPAWMRQSMSAALTRGSRSSA